MTNVSGELQGQNLLLRKGTAIYDANQNKIVDGTTGAVSANIVATAGSIGTTELADGSVTTAKIASTAVDSTKLASNAVTTVKITDANVTLAKLASGITPSHIVKFAGTASNGGGNATIAITVAGVASTDVVFAQVQASTNAVTVQKVTPTTNTITVLLSGDPGATTVIAYQALRAAS